jgi:hypothetical protein
MTVSTTKFEREMRQLNRRFIMLSSTIRTYGLFLPPDSGLGDRDSSLDRGDLFGIVRIFRTDRFSIGAGEGTSASYRSRQQLRALASL